MLFDPLYWIILGIGFLLSMVASGIVKSAFGKGQRVPISSGLRGADIAQAILDKEAIDDVNIVEHKGFLSDHYNPVTKTLALSPEVYHGRDASAAGVAAHEVGHAIQHARAYAPLHMRSLLVPVANIGSMLGPWLVIGGLFLGAAQGLAGGQTVATIGVILFGAATLFTLVTVPVEFDASSRAKHALAEMALVRPGQEQDMVSKVLLAAGLTYVAAAVSSLLQLLYWALQAGLLGNRDE